MPPAPVIVMDFIGAILLALGILKVATGMALPTDAFLPEGYAIVFIAAGVLLMLPLVKHFIDYGRGGGQPRDKGPGEA